MPREILRLVAHPKGRAICVATSLCLSFGGFAFSVQAQDKIAFVGGTLIDGRGTPPIQNATVVVEGNRITAAGPANKVSVPAGARQIRIKGKTILPGLIDTHMHIGGSGGGSVDPREFTPKAAANNFKAYLKFGVTTVFDIAGNPFIEQQKEALASNNLLGPRLFGVKYGITRPGSHPIGLLKEYKLMKLLGSVYPQITTIAEAKAAVAKAAADQTDGIKIFHSRSEFPGTSRYDADKEKFSAAILKTLVDEAHRRGLRVFAHISWPSEAREVVEAGVDVLAHNISMAETDAAAVYALMAERGTMLIPTLAQSEANFALMVDPFLLEKLRGKVWGVILDSIANPKSVVRARMNKPGYVDDARRSLKISMANLRRAVRAGVKIAMGTDAGNAGAIHGALVPREMELMVASGMTPMQVITAATKNAAEAIGQEKQLGTIEPGKLADLLVIDGDPLRDISAVRKVSLVVKAGKVFEPGAIKFED